jgi:hypothetical protein
MVGRELSRVQIARRIGSESSARVTLIGVMITPSKSQFKRFCLAGPFRVLPIEGNILRESFVLNPSDGENHMLAQDERLAAKSIYEEEWKL